MKIKIPKRLYFIFTLAFATLALLVLGFLFFKPSALAAADPNLVKTVDKTTTAVGEELTYTIRFTNTTGQTINNFVLTDTIPDNTTYVPSSYVGSPQLIGNVLTWPTINVSNGTTLATSFKVMVLGVEPPPPTDPDVQAVIYAPSVTNIGYKVSFDATQSTGWSRINENDQYGIENYAWDFGDGTPVASSTFNSALSHTFTTAGNYTVKLTVTDSRGGSNNTTKTIQVTNLPKVTASGFTNTAVNTAASSLNGQPGIIYLPAGTYDFTGQVNLRSGQVLEGEGIGQTIVRQPGSSGYAISVQGDNTAISGVTFTSSTISFPRTILFSYDGTRNVRKNLFVHNSEITHMEMGNTTPQVNAWDGAAPYASYTSGLWENNVIHLNALGGAGYGIQADRGTYFVIKNNEFYSNRHSIAGGGQSGQSADPSFTYWSYKSGYDIFNNTFHGPNAETVTCPTASNPTAKCVTDVAIDMHVGGRGRIRINNNQFQDIKFGIGLHDGWGEIKNNTFANAGSGGHIVKFTEGIHNNEYRCPSAVDALDPTKTGSEICIGAHDFNISGNTYTNMPRSTYFQFLYQVPPTNVYIDGCKVTSPTFTGKGVPGENGLECP